MENNNKVKKMYVISWNDDNHDLLYWLNENYLGCDFTDVIEGAFRLGQEDPALKFYEMENIAINPWNFPENIETELYEYFQEIPMLDTKDVELIVKAVDNELFWQEFYEKNIKK